VVELKMIKERFGGLEDAYNMNNEFIQVYCEAFSYSKEEVDKDALEDAINRITDKMGTKIKNQISK